MRIAFDIDGTLADCTHRLPLIYGPGPKQWDRFHMSCHKDRPIRHGIAIFHALVYAGHDIIFMTGRPERSRRLTENWLVEHVLGPIGWDSFFMREKVLFMRPDGDKKPDFIHKVHWCEDLEIDLMFEDRTKTVSALREAGFNVYQVQEGNY